ncbi:MAG: PEP-CTERM sorting domain-containing protein [Bryobacteraceae bacterium]|jgi:hypothetical protein
MRIVQIIPLSVLTVCFAGHAYAELLGSDVVSQYYAYGAVYDVEGSPTSFVANGTVQETFCSGCGEGFTLTVTNTQVIYDQLYNDGYWSPSYASLDSGGLYIANGNLLTFTGVTISGVTLDASSDVSGFTSANVTFNSANIAIDWAGLSGIAAGDEVILDVTTSGGSTVPEPTTLSLFGAGLIGLALIRRHSPRAEAREL